MNWLHGTPTTVSPRSPYSCASFSSAAYCGVSPHFEATLTTSTAPSASSASVVVLPSSVVSAIPPSCESVMAANTTGYVAKSIAATRWTVAIGSVSLSIAPLSHNSEKPCTRDHAASAAACGSCCARASSSVPTPAASSAPAAVSAATSSVSDASYSDLSNITA